VLNGTGTGALTASPNTVAFGAVSIGQTASTPVSLLNGSFAPIQITQLNLTGQSFSVVGPSNLPVTIAAGGTYTLNVQFNPAAAGTATGQLTIASNSSTTGTPMINLSGTGTTGTGPAALGGLSCSSGAMTGPGTDACIVTLTDAAPGGGLPVNLSSSNSAVTVPSTVTVPANATSAGFTANVSSVAAAQAVTMTASAGSMFKSFALQLNAAILALSINATSVAFGDVQVNTPATQPLTLTSTGTVPVTIGAATLTGTEFTLPGAAFPATLSPGQTATLNIEFNPTAAGAATGQLTITSNSSTNGSAVIGLSGTGTAASVVAVAVTPASASITTGATQQFAASVTGTSNTAVTWTISGTGCSGTACGTISSTGLYVAPPAVPSSASVTITAISVSDSTKSASAVISIVPPQAAGYNLAWEDTFSILSLCTTNTAGCNWYDPGIYNYSADGEITDPSGTFVNLNWSSTQGSYYTNMSTASMNGAYSRAWTPPVYIEISMAFNPVEGNWPALWLLPVARNVAGSAAGSNGVPYPEIDMIEWDNTYPTVGMGTAHVWVNNTDTYNEPNWFAFPSGTVLSNYNTYGLLWTPTAISWYFNNRLMETFSTTSAPYSEVLAGQDPMYLILSEQAGCQGVYGSCPEEIVSPLNMQVQWVHVYTPPTSP
jgi:beta-glucanase (GH16 family)